MLNYFADDARQSLHTRHKLLKYFAGEHVRTPPPERDGYEILGVSPESTIIDIEVAWQKKQREYHPDKLRAMERKLRKLAEAEFARINSAYDILRDPAKRGRYNQMLAAKTAKQKQSNQATRLERQMSKKAEIANDRAIEYWEQGRFEEAIAQWEDTARKYPNVAEVHHNLGKAYDHQGRIESAIESLKEAFAIDSTLAEAYNKLGCIYYKQNHLDVAYASWNQALRIDPGFEEALHNLRLIQNTTSFDVENEVPAYQHVTSEVSKPEPKSDIHSKPGWKNRIHRRLRKLRRR